MLPLPRQDQTDDHHSPTPVFIGKPATCLQSTYKRLTDDLHKDIHMTYKRLTNDLHMTYIRLTYDLQTTYKRLTHDLHLTYTLLT